MNDAIVIALVALFLGVASVLKMVMVEKKIDWIIQAIDGLGEMTDDKLAAQETILAEINIHLGKSKPNP